MGGKMDDSYLTEDKNSIYPMFLQIHSSSLFVCHYIFSPYHYLHAVISLID